ncbi:pleckstrin homology domain-containing family A member 5 isoform X11 [Acanthopagrus latus]|uniref:pleckstrin homology domain-containing family A member 5 isoform X11 n=2 Tax=Acanthopagrus latus TaxID=8177 RepID=UPI00187CA20B|nr:pleckstrin homology domain-containing family A member 5 isoform X11 [Acanthopagrus latus]
MRMSAKKKKKKKKKPPPVTWQKIIACVFILWARSHLLYARARNPSRAWHGPALSSPVCSNPEQYCSQLDMAADPKPDWLSCLPSSWSYGVTRDGRIFFINEEAKSTTWLHPVTGEAVITGHRKTPDLPTGWEEGYTFEGARCFIKWILFRNKCRDELDGNGVKVWTLDKQ